MAVWLVSIDLLSTCVAFLCKVLSVGSACSFRRLTWEAATDRFLDASAIHESEWPSTAAAAKDVAIWNFYRLFAGMEKLRLALGGGTASKQSKSRFALPCYCVSMHIRGVLAIR
jgi:hypothetical protein